MKKISNIFYKLCLLRQILLCVCRIWLCVMLTTSQLGVQDGDLVVFSVEFNMRERILLVSVP